MELVKGFSASPQGRNMDRGRHSVDIPLSKTIVALRRVRSLRDPSTNSMNKLSAFTNNLDWETQSCNEGFSDGKRVLGFTKRDGECGLQSVESLVPTNSRIRRKTRLDAELKVDGSGAARIGRGRRQHDAESSASVSSREMRYDDKVLMQECGHKYRNEINGDHRSKNFELKESKDSDANNGICFPLTVSNSNSCSPCYSLGQERCYSPLVSQRDNRSSGQRVLGNSKIVKALDRLEDDMSNMNSQYSPLSDCNSDLIETGKFRVDYRNYGKPSRDHIVEDFDCGGGFGCCCTRRSLKFTNKCFPHLCRCGLPSDQVNGSTSKSSKLRNNFISFGKASISETSSPSFPLLSTDHVGKCLSSHENSVFDDAEDRCSVDTRNAKLGLASRYQNHESADNVPTSLCHMFRPKGFDELVGQSLVVQSLKNAILKNKVAPFYLFQGPHGTGKTSTARVFSAALNCLSKEELKPCGLCLECIALSSGQSADIKEFDISKAKHVHRLKSFLKHAKIGLPATSRYKIFTVDDCHLLKGDQWAELLKCLKELPGQVVFLFITTDPDMLPRAVLSRCQRYQFSKIKSKDIIDRLYRLCIQESLDFDKAALEYIAGKSNGSLRDAEAMLEQLALLGQRITVPIVHELTGVISEDELLDLLDMALSADTCNTVRRSRELMISRVDPMALVSQLANLVMDILAGWRQWETSGASRKFFTRQNLTEAELQKLRNSLKILSDTEKQLRVSKNQTTWLTVALLQFGSIESSSPLNLKHAWMCQGSPGLREDNLSCSSCPFESSRNSNIGAADINEAHCLELQSDNSGKLDAIWRRTLANLPSNSLKHFLEKEGHLASICVDKGLVMAELQICNHDQVLRVERLRDHIANALRSVLGCNLEMRINVMSYRAPSTALHQTYEDRPDKRVTGDSDLNTPAPHVQAPTGSRKGINRLSYVTLCNVLPCVKTSNSKKVQNNVLHSKEMSRSDDLGRNVLGDAAAKYQKIVNAEVTSGRMSENGPGKEVKSHESQYEALAASKTRRGCFAMAFKVQRKLQPSDDCYTFDTKATLHENSGRSDPREASFNAYVCTDGSSVPSSGSFSQVAFMSKSINQDKKKNSSRIKLMLHCWKAPKFPIRKIWKKKKQHQWRSRFISWVVHCTPSE